MGTVTPVVLVYAIIDVRSSREHRSATRSRPSSGARTPSGSSTRCAATIPSSRATCGSQVPEMRLFKNAHGPPASPSRARRPGRCPLPLLPRTTPNARRRTTATARIGSSGSVTYCPVRDRMGRDDELAASIRDPHRDRSALASSFAFCCASDWSRGWLSLSARLSKPRDRTCRSNSCVHAQRGAPGSSRRRVAHQGSGQSPSGSTPCFRRRPPTHRL